MKTKVLLVDDEPRICAALAGALVSEGFDVVFVENGDEAIQATHNGLFNLVLMDLRMPGRSGWDTLEVLRQSRPQLPVIIITALPHQQTAARKAGAGALLEKPLDIPLLLETMRNVLAESNETPLKGETGDGSGPATDSGRS
jgi:DNA-binding response OmpR family regulator